jgi:hypothetical protein
MENVVKDQDAMCSGTGAFGVDLDWNVHVSNADSIEPPTV